MKIILFIILIIQCILYTPTNRTIDDLGCSQHELSRKDCAIDIAPDVISQEECENRGCCYYESSTRGVPWCFEGIDDVPTKFTLNSGLSCSLEEDLRQECGYKGIEKSECESNDCCYKITEYESEIPACFYGVEEKCYSSCENCDIKGNNIFHYCLNCNNNNPIKFKMNNYYNYYNCYPNCDYHYYFDIDGNYHCTINNNCPEDYPISEENECKKIKIIKKSMEELINNNNKKREKEEEIKYYDKILKIIEDIFTSKKFDTSYLDNGNDEIIEFEKLKVILTTSKNQKKNINNINNNMVNIDIGDFGNSLRRLSDLSEDEIIYIKILEIKQEGMLIPKIEYDFYKKLNKERLIKLNLNSFQNNRIYLIIPYKNIDNLDKLNTSSSYYNDFCYTAISDKGTDITLKDRKDEYPSKTACQDDCDFIGYNYTLKKAKCSCMVKRSSLSFADMKIEKKKLLDNIKNMKNIANLNLLKCFNVLFSKKGILENIGFYIFDAFIIFHTIILILFYLQKLDLLINKINEIISAKIYLKSKKDEEKEKNEKDGTKEEKKEKVDEIIPIEFEQKKEIEIKENKIKFIEVKDNNIINDDDNNINYINNEIAKKDKKIKIKKKRKKKKKKKKNISIINDNTIGINLNNLNNNNNIITDGNTKKETENNQKTNEIKKLESLMDYTDDEINGLSYNLALQTDKRFYCQYYISLIKTKHKLLNAFFYNKDYN